MAFFIVFYNTANVRNLYLTVNRYQVDTLWFLLCDCGNRIILKEGRRDFAIVTRKKCDNWWKTQEIQTLRKARNSVLYFRQPGLMKEDSIRIFCATRLRNLISSFFFRVFPRQTFETMSHLWNSQWWPTYVINSVDYTRLPDWKFDPDRLFKWRRKKDEAEDGSHR